MPLPTDSWPLVASIRTEPRSEDKPIRAAQVSGLALYRSDRLTI